MCGIVARIVHEVWTVHNRYFRDVFYFILCFFLSYRKTDGSEDEMVGMCCRLRMRKLIGFLMRLGLDLVIHIEQWFFILNHLATKLLSPGTATLTDTGDTGVSSSLCRVGPRLRDILVWSCLCRSGMVSGTSRHLPIALLIRQTALSPGRAPRSRSGYSGGEFCPHMPNRTVCPLTNDVSFLTSIQPMVMKRCIGFETDGLQKFSILPIAMSS